MFIGRKGSKVMLIELQCSKTIKVMSNIYLKDLAIIQKLNRLKIPKKINFIWIKGPQDVLIYKVRTCKEGKGPQLEIIMFLEVALFRQSTAQYPPVQHNHISFSRLSMFRLNRIIMIISYHSLCQLCPSFCLKRNVSFSAFVQKK